MVRVNTAPTATRLLSLLSAIESALAANECASARGRPQRFVNFQKGLARMTFADGSGAITLQSFTLADGQTCVKAEYVWAGNGKTGAAAVYPSGENFDWQGASFRLAEGWMDGLPEPGAELPSGERYQAAV